MKLWTTICGDIGKEDYLLKKKGQFCLYKERKVSAGGIYCPFVVSQVCPTMGSCFKMKRRLLFCGSWDVDVYIGTPFVKKYPMSNLTVLKLIGFYSRLWPSRSWTLGSLILKSFSSFLSCIKVKELQQVFSVQFISFIIKLWCIFFSMLVRMYYKWMTFS